MARLKVYTVHVNPALPHPYESAEFVGEGFNWKAFVFTTLWALYHRLWLPAILLIIYNFVLLNMFYSGIFSHAAIGIVDIGVHIILGFEANEWLRARLKAKGYLTADITTGDSQLRAELRFFDRYFAANPASPA